MNYFKRYFFFLVAVPFVCSCSKQKNTVLINASEDSSYVYINNEYKGKTPLVINNLPSNKYELKIAKEGYDNYIDSFEIHAGDITTLNIKLPAQEITYIDDYWGFKVNYPADWNKVFSTTSKSVSFMAPKKVGDEVNIGFGIGVKEAYLFYDSAESIEKKMENCVEETKNNQILLCKTILSKGVISINSYPAYRIESIFSYGSKEIKSCLINIFANNKVYSMTFMAVPTRYDQYYKTFDRMANSFSIVK